jgi:hypothetical protein
MFASKNSSKRSTSQLQLHIAHPIQAKREAQLTRLKSNFKNTGIVTNLNHPHTSSPTKYTFSTDHDLRVLHEGVKSKSLGKWGIGVRNERSGVRLT